MSDVSETDSDNDPPLPDVGVVRAIQRANRGERNIAALAERLSIYQSPEMHEANPVYRKVMTVTNGMLSLTNFTEGEVRSFADDVTEFMARGPGGRQPSVSVLDSIILLLHKLKANPSTADLAMHFGQSVHCTTKALTVSADAMRGMLLHKHIACRPRPKILPAPLTDIGLLVDTTFFRIPRTYGSPGESRTTWNGHKHCHCLKKEVAVEAVAPYRALFWSQAAYGSQADRTIFKRYYGQYVQYLTKTPSELAQFPAGTEPSWSILGDSAYVKRVSDTPGVRIIAIARRTQRQSAEELVERADMKRKRVHVEWFFGRLKGLWGIVRETYRYKEGSFDATCDLCIMLTNEHIEAVTLDTHDGALNTLENELPALEHQERLTKDRARQARIRTTRKLRAASMTDMDDSTGSD